MNDVREPLDPGPGIGAADGQGLPDRPEHAFWRYFLARMRWRDQRFYPLFDLHAQLCTGAVSALLELLADLSDPRNMVREIEAMEKRADAVVDDVHATLRRSWFPPHPRAAIVDLINRLDDVLDLTEDAAQTIHLYHITVLTPEAMRLAQLALDSTKLIQHAVTLLAHRDKRRDLLAVCAKVDDLEAQADHVLRAAMSKLFRDEPDARELIKLRAVYEVLEELTDVCKDVATELEAIVLGHLA